MSEPRAIHSTLEQAARLLPLPGTHPHSTPVHQHGNVLPELSCTHGCDARPPHGRDEP